MAVTSTGTFARASPAEERPRSAIAFHDDGGMSESNAFELIHESSGKKSVDAQPRWFALEAPGELLFGAATGFAVDHQRVG